MTRQQLLTAIDSLENELADAGLDNRHVPQRKVNSRRKHIGSGYLEDASDEALGRFYIHLTNVRKRCLAEREVEDALDGVTLDAASFKRIERMLRKGLKGCTRY